MKSIWFYTFFVLFLFNARCSNIGDTSTTITQEMNSSRNAKPQNQIKGAEFNDILYKCITDYILEVDKNFYNKEWLYYSLFFFDIDSVHYFTMWTFTCFPSYISSCIEKNKYRFYLYSIRDRKVVIIDKKSNVNPLFIPSRKNILSAKKEDKRDYGGDIYDGSFYFQTDQIKENSNGVYFDKIDTAITHFINCHELNIELEE